MVSVRLTDVNAQSLPTVAQADCVFPTRTARFGVALTFKGPLNLSMSNVVNIAVHTQGLITELGKHTSSMEPIDKNCPCPTCASGMSRAMLHHVVTIETAGAHGNSGAVSCDLINWYFVNEQPLRFTTLFSRRRLWAVQEMLS